MFAAILALAPLLLGSTLAQYPPSYLYATGIDGTSYGMVGMFSHGEGKDVLILTDDDSRALMGQFEGSYWTFNGFKKSHSMRMSPMADSKDYPHHGDMSCDMGLTTSGFSEGDEDGLLVWNNMDMGNGGSYFAFCSRMIPGHESEGMHNQMYWQSNEAMGMDGCTTIVIHGAYQ